MAKELIITEGDIDHEFDLLLEKWEEPSRFSGGFDALKDRRSLGDRETPAAEDADPPSSKDAGEEKSASKKKETDEVSIQRLQSFVDDNQSFHEEVLNVLGEEDINDIVFLAQELPGLPSIALQEGTLGQSLKKWISRGRCGQAARALLPQLLKGKKYIAHELAKVKKYEDEEKDTGNQKNDVKAAVQKFSSLFQGALEVLKCSKGRPPEEACSNGRVKNDEGECRCPPGYRWEPAKALSEVEGDVIPPDAEGKCVKDEGEPAKRLESTIKIYDWISSKGGVTVIGGPKYKGGLPKDEWAEIFGPQTSAFMEMYLMRIFGAAILKRGGGMAIKKDGDDIKVNGTAALFEGVVAPAVEKDLDKVIKIILSFVKAFTPVPGKPPEESVEDYLEKHNMEVDEEALKKVQQTYEELREVLSKYKKLIEDDNAATIKYNALAGEYLMDLKKKILKKMPDDIVKGLKDSIEDQEESGETLQEGMLHSITIDFAEIRRKQKHLDESFLVMFGAWVKWLLEKMFGGGSIPGTIKGSKSEVESFARAMGSEKSYIETAKRYGLDHPTTYKNKAKLSSATKSFEKKTGIKWPFE